MIKRIGVIGAGQMGSGIAHVCALNGFDVRLADVDQALSTRASTRSAATSTARSAAA